VGSFSLTVSMLAHILTKTACEIKKTMKKNITIITLVVLCIALIFLLLKPTFKKSANLIIQFPKTKLESGERILCVTIDFQSVSINSIRNIPPGWEFDLKLNPPPNPTARGCMTVGASALASTDELPYFEVEPYTKDAKEISAHATLDIDKYPEGRGKARKMIITGIAKKP